MYDFLYQDIQPSVSLLADIAQLSLPQTRLALSASLQAIISALLAYQQRHKGQVLSKKLFERGAIKELRQYHSMNFETLSATLYLRNDIADSVFGNMETVIKVSQRIAEQVDTTAARIKTLLTSLSVLVLRELAILADYSQLDHDELDKWFALQPQFLSAARFATNQYITIPNDNKLNVDDKNTITDKKYIDVDNISLKDSNTEDTSIVEETARNVSITKIILPPFDPYWYELTQFTPVDDASGKALQQATPNYLQAIGRSAENAREGHHDDRLVFAPMPAIALPHQRWLLQLAKIADIYLSRNRLRITSEPDSPPIRPLVSLGLIADSNDNTPTLANKISVKLDEPVPLWKNPVILIIIVVIGSLSALATLKYQAQKSQGTIPATETVLEQDQAKQIKKQNKITGQIVQDNEKPLTNK